jgi:hypothetical protein
MWMEDEETKKIKKGYEINVNNSGNVHRLRTILALSLSVPKCSAPV